MQHNKTQWLALLGLSLSIQVAACSSDDGGGSGAGGAGALGGAGGVGGAAGGGAGGVGGSVTPAGETTFAAIYNDILAEAQVGNCMFSACHGGAPSVGNGGLQMFPADQAMTYAALVNKPSYAEGACAGRTLVVPGQPEMSLLYRKLAGTQDCGAQMPVAPLGMLLTPGQLEQIRVWIANGAMNDGTAGAGGMGGGMGGASGAAGAMGGEGGMGGMGGEGGTMGGMGGEGGTMSGGTFALTSSAFEDGGMLPAENRCVMLGGETGPSPQFSWSNPPADTMSFALTMTDQETQGSNGGYMHWTIWDIPATEMMLPSGVMRIAMPSAPAGAKQCDNENIFVPGPGYFGPCGMDSNPYEFKLWALDVATLPDVTTSSTPAEVRAAIDMHDIGSVAITANSGP